MKRQNEKIEVKVEPHSSSLRFYVIRYRPLKRFNLFNFWRTLVEVWDGASLNYSQPVMFEKFEHAVEYAKRIKDDPSLIDKHYEEQDKIYEKARERRIKYNQERNKSAKL